MAGLPFTVREHVSESTLSRTQMSGTAQQVITQVSLTYSIKEGFIEAYQLGYWAKILLISTIGGKLLLVKEKYSCLARLCKCTG